jgi:hypothetical protein
MGLFAPCFLVAEVWLLFLEGENEEGGVGNEVVDSGCGCEEGEKMERPEGIVAAMACEWGMIMKRGCVCWGESLVAVEGKGIKDTNEQQQ